MLGKLLKYDFKSLYRTFLPLWAMVLALAGITRLLEGLPSNRQSLGDIFDAQDIAMIVLVSVFIAIGVISAVLVVQRFYKGLLRDEGYLMFTLPVPAWKLVLSKLLSAASIFYVSSLVGVLVCLILVGGPEFSLAMRFVFSGEEGQLLQAMIWRMVPLLIMGPLAAVLQAYLAMALGHLVKKHRIAASIGAYLGINMVSNILSTQIGALITYSSNVTSMSSSVSADLFDLLDLVSEALTVGTCVGLVQILIFFSLTVLILHKSLNLE